MTHTKASFFRRLTAMLLAAALLTGGVSTVFADGETDPPTPPPVEECQHDYQYDFDDEGNHWRKCSICKEIEPDSKVAHSFTSKVVEPTCTEKGYTEFSCVCGNKYTEDGEAALGHAFAASFDNDDAYHWHNCGNSGCGEVSEKESHTFGDWEETPETNTKTRVCTKCDFEEKGKIKSEYTVTFKNGSTTVGSPQTVVEGGFATAPSNPTYSGNGSGTFVCWTAAQNASIKTTGTTAVDIASYAINANVTFYAVYNVALTGKKASVTLNASASDYSFSGSTTASASAESQIKSIVSTNLSTTLTKVVFGSAGSSTYGTLYANSSKTSLGDREFAASGTSYPLSGVYYVPTSTRGTYSISFTAYDDCGNTVAGTLSLVTQSAPSSGTVTYEVAGNDTVTFSRDDFNKVFQKAHSSYTLRWLEFPQGGSFSSSKGYVYYNYDSSNEKKFTSSSFDDYKFYYSSTSYGDYPINSLTFVPSVTSGDYTLEIPFTAYYNDSLSANGILKLSVDENGSTGSITYELDADETVTMKKSDFNDFFQKEYSSYTMRYVEFDSGSSLGSSKGYFYYNYGSSGEERFTASTIDDSKFYYSSSSYGDYPLEDLTYVPGSNTGSYTVEIGFTAYYSTSRKVEGKLKLVVGEDDSAGSITYTVAPGNTIDLKADDFSKLFKTEYAGYNLRWVSFKSGSSLSSTNGYIYYNYGSSGEERFTASTIDDSKFYYSSSSYGDYPLDDLTFVPGSKTGEYTITIDFTAYYSSSRYTTGELVIKVSKSGATESSIFNIYYNCAESQPVSFNPSDFNAYLKKTYPSSTLEYIALGGLPSSGTLYYNYGGASSYGVANRKQLTSSNYDGQVYYFSPSSTSSYSLGELTYLPVAGNYCVSIPFTAYASASRYVEGNILISANGDSLPEIYRVTARGGRHSIAASDFASAISKATGLSFSYLRFTDLPEASDGALYYNYSSASNFGHKVTASNSYYSNPSSSQYGLSLVTFVPSATFKGSVSVPYVAYSSSGTAIASGRVSFGVVNSIKSFSDVNSTHWFYKYVIELGDDAVVNGYPDGSFKPSGNLTWGEALKLIMLAAGYTEQAPTTSHWASGYLAKALSSGLLPASVSLDAAPTRLEVAQLAAKAMKLTSVSGGSPFSDTNDGYVLALNRAGIVVGSINLSGKRLYNPSQTISRSEISAIVWRINRAG